MDFKEAVELAKAGEERGFGYLYANTHESKYYLALQYMKDEELAKDVLQDAYLKAFTNLDKLQQPEAFAGWLGTIVANTAKNTLAKKTPILFADVAVDEEGEGFEYQIEDENMETQPETAYTRKETQELVHELIDSLSDEQRLCILMFHIEGASISEIASSMECSENTVKSRLNYGRKNLKAKAEELQKKGYKLYSVAPLPLLLFLLRSEEQAMFADGTLSYEGGKIADEVFDRLSDILQNAAKTDGMEMADDSDGTGQPLDAKNMAAGVKTAGKSGLLHTAAAKITAATMIGLITLGGIYYGLTHKESPDSPPVETELAAGNETSAFATEASSETEASTVTKVPSETEVAAETEIPVSTTEPPSEKEVEDNEYSSLIQGNLTKEELEFVLAYGPKEMSGQEIEETEYIFILNDFCESGDYIKDYGCDAKYKSMFNVKDVNRLFSSFTDYQFTEENDTDSEEGLDVDGKIIKFFPATLSYVRNVHITSATYTPKKMEVYFTYENISDENGTTTYQKKAVLLPLPNGKYRIHKIEIVTDKPKPSSNNKSAGKKDTTSIKALYKGVLKSLKKGEPDYQMEYENPANYKRGPYEYFVADLDGDGIKELIVGDAEDEGTISGYDFRIFSCKKSNNGYRLKPIKGSHTITNLCISKDGNRLYETDFSPGTGIYSIYQITIKSGTLVSHPSKQSEIQMGTKEEKQFFDENPSVNWTDISDLSGLDGL